MGIIKNIAQLFLFSSFFLLAHSEPFNVSSIISIHRYLLKKAPTENGFGSQTQIKINNTFSKIEHLQTGDVIFSPQKNNFQKIILKQELYLPYYFKINVGGVEICAAPAQLFYDNKTKNWVQAQDLKKNHVIGGYFVDQAVRVDAYCKMHKLHLEDQLFIVEKNILVHNEALAIATAFGINIGRFILTYPIIRALGRTISMQKMWDKLSHLWNVKEQAQTDDPVYTHYICKLTESVRSYYTIRRTVLLDLLKKYRQMQQILEMTTNQSFPGIALWNKSFITYDAPLLPDFDIEAGYSYQDQQKLLQLRDQEIKQIEEEVVQIQLHSAIFFNEILDYQDCLVARLQNCAHEVNKLEALYSIKINVAFQNKQLFAEVIDLLEQRYKKLIFIEALLQDLLVRSRIWSKITQIYCNHPETFLFRESSDILESCGRDYYQNMVNMPDDVQAQLSIIQSRIKLCHELFKKYKSSISYDAIRQVLQSAQIEINKSEENHRQNIIIKKQNIKFVPPPNDPDSEDEKGFFEKLKKNHKGKAKSSKGLLFEDPKTGLWFSEDKAGHGGFHYKVYRAMKKEFEWIYNVDIYGEIIQGQHKGPVGKFISYKDVVFFK